jgi:HKD family nuclease
MSVRYLVQPSIQVGRIVSELLDSDPPPTELILVSAFASRQTLLRLKPSVSRLKERGCRIRLVLGIDMGGTSKEALVEAHSWRVDTRIIKHRRAGHTFHPKVCIIERPGRAAIIVGSSNITDGGFYTNYEGGVLLSYELPAEEASYAEARRELRRFLEPDGPTVQVLSDELIAILRRRGDIPTNEEQRRARTGERRKSEGEDSPFGIESIPTPPPVPGEVLTELLDEVRSERRLRLRKGGIRARRAQPAASVQIAPMSFYMTLPKMRGSIPGEPRVPLEARDLAPKFWGWRDKYTHERGPRGSGREYWNWKPRWRLWNSEAPATFHIDEVRMYEYTDSSDFRFYSHRLLELGANKGDVVRITRIAEPGVEFECALARRGTAAYDEWVRCCTEPVRASDRHYGYA